MHVKLYENQRNLTKEDLSRYAKELKLNVQAFDNCVNSEKYRSLVLRNRQDGLAAGIEGTPTLLVNDLPLIGLPEYENLVQIIETELKK
jgi:protein-disulfide isomerase